MRLYRYMKYDEFENAYLNKYFKFRYSEVWEDSLESLFVKYASKIQNCKELIEIYQKRYPSMPNNEIFTDITNIVALSLQTRCQCWSTNGNSDTFWECDNDYICLGVEYVNSDEFNNDFKVKGHDIKYIENVDINKIVDYFGNDRYLSSLQIVKDKSKYENEEEFRLVATPINPIFPQKMPMFNFDEMAKNNNKLVRAIVDYTEWVRKTVLCPHDTFLKLNNMKVVSIRVHPNMSPKTAKKFNRFCEKYFINFN